MLQKRKGENYEKKNRKYRIDSYIIIRGIRRLRKYAGCTKRHTEIRERLRQNISQEQMQQFMRKQHEDSIEVYKTESADCEKRQKQIKIQNRQNYEKYHEGQMDQKQFVEAKKQLEEERERLQKRVQELAELINAEKDILMKKNVPVEQMLKYLGYEKLTREMLEEYVQGIYVYDDGRVEMEWKFSKDIAK